MHVAGRGDATIPKQAPTRPTWLPRGVRVSHVGSAWCSGLQPLHNRPLGRDLGLRVRRRPVLEDSGPGSTMDGGCTRQAGGDVLEPWAGSDLLQQRGRSHRVEDSNHRTVGCGHPSEGRRGLRLRPRGENGPPRADLAGQPQQHASSRCVLRP